MLREGTSPSDIARNLRISRMTVYRYKKASQEQDGALIPKPKPQGGFRWSLVNRKALVRLSNLSLQHPKWTVEEIRDEAVRRGWLQGNPKPSTTTVWRSLRKTGMRHARASYVDPKATHDSLIRLEKMVFQSEQKQNPQLAIDKLLWFDESNFRLNEQAKRAWGPQGTPPRLERPKGKSPTTNLMLAIGVSARNDQVGGTKSIQGTQHDLIIHWKIHTRQREFDPLPSTYQSWELEQPGEGEDVGHKTEELPDLSAHELARILRAHGISRAEENQVRHKKRATKAVLLRRVRELQEKGKLGMPRSGRRDIGGPKLPFRATAADVLQFWQEFTQQWKVSKNSNQPRTKQSRDSLALRTVVWDNASTHSAVQVGNTHTISVFHRRLRELGLAGAVFLPPRSPQFNPAELAFAYTKHWVRKWAPPRGYSEDELVLAMERALRKITSAMVRGWAAKCGYHEHPTKAIARTERQRQQQAQKQKAKRLTCYTPEAQLPKKGRLLCANAHGSVVKEKPEGRNKWVWKAPERDSDSETDRGENVDIKSVLSDNEKRMEELLQTEEIRTNTLKEQIDSLKTNKANLEKKLKRAQEAADRVKSVLS